MELNSRFNKSLGGIDGWVDGDFISHEQCPCLMKTKRHPNRWLPLHKNANGMITDHKKPTIVIAGKVGMDTIMNNLLKMENRHCFKTCNITVYNGVSYFLVIFYRTPAIYSCRTYNAKKKKIHWR